MLVVHVGCTWWLYMVVVHGGCTRCVTSNTDHSMNVHMQIHAWITLTVECIRTCMLMFFFDV
jgi:hypothetical protein